MKKVYKYDKYGFTVKEVKLIHKFGLTKKETFTIKNNPFGLFFFFVITAFYQSLVYT